MTASVIYSQIDSSMQESELEVRINRALDYFGEGDYERAITILENVLVIDPDNKRAADLLASIRELYKIETDTGNGNNGADQGTTERPDFSFQDPQIEEDTPDEGEPDEEELEKPDFSIHDEESLLSPEQTRSIFELSLSPNLVFPWDMGEDSVVFPERGSLSGSFSADIDYFLNAWNRIIGFSGAYSLFLLDPDWGDFPDGQLHVVDALFNFRTFFNEEIDSRIIFKLGIGYRGYFAGGYDFHTIERSWLNGFNMGINLEGPLIYLFVNREGLKRLIFDLDMNLLFFPEINTLNLFDFRINTRLQLKNFAIGVHFGAYSVITTDDVEYIWMTGMNFSLRF